MSLLKKTVSSEEGFVIPIAMGMGLIMILLATTAILRSQDGGVAAVNTSAKAQSRNVAELKVAQIQALLNRYRTAANLPSTSSTGTNWGNATATTLPTANAVCFAPSAIADSISAINGMANTAWTDVSATDPTRGQYRLVSYSGADGNLIVEGRAKAGTSAEATSQISATVPVLSPALEQVPGIWAKTSMSGSPVVKSDVMGPCSGTMDVSFPSTGVGSDKVLLKTRLTMPAAPAQPTSGTYYSSTTTTPITNISSVPDKQLPRSGDTPDTDGVYKYVVSSIDSSFKIEPGKKVYIWVTGNIDLQNKVIVNQCGATTGTPAALVNPDCGPFDVRIYGTATSSPTLTLNQTGTAVCDVFFHLPNYGVTVNTGGTAHTQDCGGTATNTGIYWVNTWSSASGTTLDANRGTWQQVTVWDTATSAWKALVTPPPRISPLQGWDQRTAS
ncbi:MAG: hypothetical protein HC852_04515 [Acaryochloridaceae cyanobacterium RU_4_10]|nr:hypothetical protein [Acaryochloridaceae cyanobacterium RU_4_10]